MCFFNEALASRVSDLVSILIELTFSYRDLGLLIQGADCNNKSGYILLEKSKENVSDEKIDKLICQMSFFQDIIKTIN